MKLIDHILRFIAPIDCVSCNAEGDILCNKCRRTLVRLPSRCYRCSRLTVRSRTCTRCRSSSRLSHVWVITDYNAIAKKVIHSLKFEFSRDTARTIAEEMYAILPQMTPDTIIVHVPAATSRVRQRGFDQSALIARELSYISGLRHVHALARLGQLRQVGTSGATRRQQLRDVFRVVSVDFIAGKKVLLIDDVLTTGSTLEEAAQTLKNAQVGVVAAVTFAQATR